MLAQPSCWQGQKTGLCTQPRSSRPIANFLFVMAIITRCKEVSRASYRIYWFSLVVVLSRPILCYYFCYCPFLLVAPTKGKITGSSVQNSIFPKEPSSPPPDWSSKKNLFFEGKYLQVLTSSCSVI